MKIRPLNDNVILRRSTPETTSKGGIILADTAQEKNLRAEVLAVGPGSIDGRGERIPIDLKVGDVALLGNKYSGAEITVDGEKYLVAREDDIVAVIDQA